MASKNTRQVSLSPKAGFVIKTTCQEAGSYSTQLGTPPIASAGSPSTYSPTVVAVHRGFKVFLNICWDPNVPSPPERSEDQIRRAMTGADLDEGIYYVPVVVSDGRPVTDKAGKPSLVFDCVFSSTLRLRSNKDTEFRTFLTEIALERVEDKSGLSLSRELATPNISSKGPLESRTVSIPVTLANPAPKAPLIQEITSPSGPPTTSQPKRNAVGAPVEPTWTSEATPSGLKVTIQVPHLTKSLLSSDSTTLDVEAHRIIFAARGLYQLDLSVHDAEGNLSVVTEEPKVNVPALSKARKALNPDSATAEWQVKRSHLVLRAEWE